MPFLTLFFCLSVFLLSLSVSWVRWVWPSLGTRRRSSLVFRVCMPKGAMCKYNSSGQTDRQKEEEKERLWKCGTQNSASPCQPPIPDVWLQPRSSQFVQRNQRLISSGKFRPDGWWSNTNSDDLWTFIVRCVQSFALLFLVICFIFQGLI